MPRSNHLIPVLALPALAAGAIAIGSGSSSAQGPAPRTLNLTELQKGATFTHIRNTKTTSRRANSAGDVIVFTNPVADRSGTVVGKLSAVCTTTTGARNFVKSVVTCNGVLVLPDGTMTWQANISLDSPTTTSAVTGGTGAYANTRGVVVSKQGPHGSHDTITLAN
jgi:Allene oxide cyclase barrel like domain